MVVALSAKTVDKKVSQKRKKDHDFMRRTCNN